MDLHAHAPADRATLQFPHNLSHFIELRIFSPFAPFLYV